MDKRVKVAFFKLSKDEAADPKFVDCLEAVQRSKNAGHAMEQSLGKDVHVRMERIARSGDIWTGEIARVQKTNMPFEVTASGAKPLSIKNPLGHGVAFKFDGANSILALQYDARVSSVSRLIDYCQHFLISSLYAEPLLKRDALNRLGQKNIRSFEIAIASPKSFAALGKSGVHQSVENLAHAFDAETIKITVSAGHKLSPLSNANSIIRGLAAKAMHITGLRAVTDAPRSSGDKFIDILTEHLTEDETLDIPDNEPDERYRVCQEFVDKCFTKNRTYILTTYGNSGSS